MMNKNLYNKNICIKEEIICIMIELWYVKICLIKKGFLKFLGVWTCGQ